MLGSLNGARAVTYALAAVSTVFGRPAAAQGIPKDSTTETLEWNLNPKVSYRVEVPMMNRCWWPQTILIGGWGEFIPNTVGLSGPHFIMAIHASGNDLLRNWNRVIYLTHYAQTRGNKVCLEKRVEFRIDIKTSGSDPSQRGAATLRTPVVFLTQRELTPEERRSMAPGPSTPPDRPGGGGGGLKTALPWIGAGVGALGVGVVLAGSGGESDNGPSGGTRVCTPDIDLVFVGDPVLESAGTIRCPVGGNASHTIAASAVLRNSSGGPLSVEEAVLDLSGGAACGTTTLTWTAPAQGSPATLASGESRVSLSRQLVCSGADASQRSCSKSVTVRLRTPSCGTVERAAIPLLTAVP